MMLQAQKIEPRAATGRVQRPSEHCGMHVSL